MATPLEHLDRALEVLYCGTDSGDPEGIVIGSIRAAVEELGGEPRGPDDCPGGPVGVVVVLGPAEGGIIAGCGEQPDGPTRRRRLSAR